MRILSILSLAVITCVWTVSVSAVERWRESTFKNFRDGTFGDGGVNTYVSARGRIQTVYRHDANNDGYIDLVFANTHSDAVQVDMSSTGAIARTSASVITLMYQPGGPSGSLRQT